MKTTEVFHRVIMILVIISFFGLISGCNKNDAVDIDSLSELNPGPAPSDLPPASGGLVLSVGSDIITADEVITPRLAAFQQLAGKTTFEEFSKKARPYISRDVMGKVTDILLYQKAQKKAPDNIDEMLEKAVETEVNRFVAEYDGDYSRSLEEISRRGLVDWQGYRDYQKRLMLTQSYISKELSKTAYISRQQIREYYDNNKEKEFSVEGSWQISLIDIEVNDDVTKEAAMELAAEISEKLKAGQGFAELAKAHSNGNRAEQGGLWDPMSFDSLASPYDVLEKRAAGMKPGQVTEPIAVEGHVFVAKLEKWQEKGVVSFEEVQDKIEMKLQFEDRKQRFDTIVDKLVKNANIEDMDRFVDFCVEAVYQSATAN